MKLTQKIHIIIKIENTDVCLSAIHCKYQRVWARTHNPGVDKVREQGAFLPGNDKKSSVNHGVVLMGYKENLSAITVMPLRKKILCPPLPQPLEVLKTCTVKHFT